MKQNVKMKRRVSASRRSSQFFIEMDARGIILFLMLVLLTAAVVFYLGFIFGKATRDPNDPNLKHAKISDSKASDKQTLSKKDLNIYKIKEDKKKAASLTAEAKSAMKKVDQLMKGEKPSVKAAPKTSNAKPPTKPVAITKSGEKPEAKQPDATTSEVEKLYTIQIIATRNNERAGDIVKHLKRKGFEAYLVEVQAGGKKIYRVRVGKQAKTEISKLMTRLEKVIGGMGIKPKIVQVD